MTGRERNLDVVSPFLTFFELFQSGWNVELMKALSPPVVLNLHLLVLGCRS